MRRDFSSRFGKEAFYEHRPAWLEQVEGVQA